MVGTAIRCREIWSNKGEEAPWAGWVYPIGISRLDKETIPSASSVSLETPLKNGGTGGEVILVATLWWFLGI